MFCAKCGAADQQPENYCRSCGTFLPDLSKPVKKLSDPHHDIHISSTLTFMSAVVSLSMAITLLVVALQTPVVHWVMTLSLALFGANFFWQISTFWRTRQIKKHLPPKKAVGGASSMKFEDTSSTNELLMPGDERFIERPASVTENTTKLLNKR